MSRTYTDWSNSRGYSNKTLGERSSITNIVNGNKRYYSSVDAEIYFGDIYIDEVTSIEWAVQQQAMPIFGYNSYCFDDMAIGSRMVSGQFSVNFTQAGFLINLQKDSAFTKISRKLYAQDKKADSYFTDDFRKRLNMPVWDGGFDIVVGFGDHSKSLSSVSNTLYKTYLVLDCCQITGSMTQLDYNGIPVQEIYTFMARDIKYPTNQSNSAAIATDAEKNPVGDKEENTVSKKQLSLSGVFNMTNADSTTIKLKSTTGTKLSSGNISIISTLKSLSLKKVLELSLNSEGELIATLEKPETQLLKKEIADYAYTKLRVKAEIYYIDSTVSTEAVRTTATINFQIKTS